jgi:hypothetical protein
MSNKEVRNPMPRALFEHRVRPYVFLCKVDTVEISGQEHR